MQWQRKLQMSSTNAPIVVQQYVDWQGLVVPTLDSVLESPKTRMDVINLIHG